MKKIFLLLSALGLLISSPSCDTIPEDEYLLNNGGTNPIDTSGQGTITHKVLLEEFTGVKCNNCPAATAKAKNLQSIYGKENLILLAIHAGNLATTDANHPKAFNTQEGTELFNFFQLFGVPVGFVNRLDYDEGRIIKPDGNWAGIVSSELTRSPVASIEINEESYNSANMELTVSGTVKTLSSLTSNTYLCVYLAENDIISAQTMGDKSVNPNYEHDHVFRGSFSGTYGTPIDLSSGTASFNESISLPADAVKENCEVIAFIYDRDNYEILQAQSIEI